MGGKSLHVVLPLPLGKEEGRRKLQCWGKMLATTLGEEALPVSMVTFTLCHHAHMQLLFCLPALPAYTMPDATSLLLAFPYIPPHLFSIVDDLEVHYHLENLQYSVPVPPTYVITTIAVMPASNSLLPATYTYHLPSMPTFDPMPTYAYIGKGWEAWLPVVDVNVHSLMMEACSCIPFPTHSPGR